MNSLSKSRTLATPVGSHQDGGSRGQAMYALAEELFPEHRTVCGAGSRRTLRRLQELLPRLEIKEVPTGTPVFDWSVPQEWTIRDAYIKNTQGERVVDYRTSNLHVASHSVPVSRQMTLRDLKPHLYSLPAHPDSIPYKSLHFQDDWSFCLTDRRLEQLRAAGDDAVYEVVIDATLANGSMAYGELLIPGEATDEVLIATHVCHPSLANDNLSGVVVATYLAMALAEHDSHYSYRFLFIPATIGSITWLAAHQADAVPRILYGLVLACLGDRGDFTYKCSRRGNSPLDLAALHAFGATHHRGSVRSFAPHGYDERQFNSPAFDLPIGRLTRTPNGEYPEYHTSADDLSLIGPAQLEESLQTCWELLAVAENDPIYVNQHPWCEPRLSRHDLHRAYAHDQHDDQLQEAVMWLLNLADGKHSLQAIATKTRLPISQLRVAADRLTECGLIKQLSDHDNTPGHS